MNLRQPSAHRTFAGYQDCLRSVPAASCVARVHALSPRFLPGSLGPLWVIMGGRAMSATRQFRCNKRTLVGAHRRSLRRRRERDSRYVCCAFSKGIRAALRDVSSLVSELSAKCLSRRLGVCLGSSDALRCSSGSRSIRVQMATQRQPIAGVLAPTQSDQICTMSAVPSTAIRQESGNPNRQ